MADINDDEEPPNRHRRMAVKTMTKDMYEKKYGKRPYLQKNLSDWDFKDVLDFFQKSVTNDPKCIDIIRSREV